MNETWEADPFCNTSFPIQHIRDAGVAGALAVRLSDGSLYRVNNGVDEHSREKYAHNRANFDKIGAQRSWGGPWSGLLPSRGMSMRLVDTASERMGQCLLTGSYI